MEQYALDLTETALEQLNQLVDWSQQRYNQSVVSLAKLHGGLTNQTFKLELNKGQELILRIAGPATTKYLDRKAEYVNGLWAAEKGLGPEILHFNAATGNSVVQYVWGETLGIKSFSSSTSLLQKGAQFAKKLHEGGPILGNNVDPFKLIPFYKNLTQGGGYNKRLNGWGEIEASVAELEQLYSLCLDPVACHNDLLPLNFIWDKDRLWLLDWEHSGNNDRYFDLGGFCLENFLTTEEENFFLETYWERPPTSYEKARLQLGKILVGAMWGEWAIMQIALGKEEDFYWSYGQGRYDESLELIRSPHYAQWLALLKEQQTGEN